MQGSGLGTRTAAARLLQSLNLVKASRSTSDSINASGTQRRVGLGRFNPRCFSSADLVQGPALLKTSAHRPRPGLLSLPGLRSLPFWSQYGVDGATHIAYSDPILLDIVNHLESKWHHIRDEYDDQKATTTSDYDTKTEHATLHEGQWDWRSYMRKGEKQPEFAIRFPETTKVLEALDEHLFTGLPFGYSFLSTLHKQSRIKAHTSPINLRLRIHLGLHVPTGDCGISVGGIQQPWMESKCLVLDDAFTHHVWNDTASDRVILLVDIWHPDIGIQERTEIVSMFQEAQAKGWFNKSQKPPN